MISADIIAQLRTSISEDLDFSLVNHERIEIGTPFVYRDGDHCGFVVEADASTGGWQITDEGDVLMHASYSGVDLLGEGRSERFRKTLNFYGLREHDGTLYLPFSSAEQFGDAFFTFSQACLDIVGMTRLPAERKKSLQSEFRKQVHGLVENNAAGISVARNWHHPTLDPNGVYGVDYYIEGKNKRLGLFAIGSNTAALHAALSCHQYKQLQLEFVAIYDDESHLSPNASTPLNEIVSRRFDADEDAVEIAALIRAA